MLVKLAAIFFSMILVNTYVLVKFYGICPFLGVSKKLDSAVGMSGAVIFVMFMATAVTFPIQIFVLDPAGLSYLQTIVFILVIAVLVQFIEIFLKKCASAWKPAIPRLPLRACPSPCWLPRSPACLSWVSAASSRTCLM